MKGVCLCVCGGGVYRTHGEFGVEWGGCPRHGCTTWTGSSSLSSWSRDRMPARLMFIHYTSLLCPADSVLGDLVTLMMFQTAH